MDHFHVEGDFPAFITGRQSFIYPQFTQKLQENRAELQRLLLKHGALVFRGFPIREAEQFTEVIEALDLGKFVNYIGGDSPRHKVTKAVYTSTEAPPSFHIPLHQELSFIQHFPRHIYFFCETAPKEKGETIIGDARLVYQSIHSEVKARFQNKNLIYTSHYYHRNRLIELLNRMRPSHKSWTDVFECHDKKEVEKKCLENAFQWKWLKNDWLKISQHRPAILQHPQTQDSVWFNQVHLYDFNPRLLGWLNYVGVQLFYIRPSTRLHEVRFGDGSRIPRSDLYHIMDVLQDKTVRFPWQNGDVMVLDNILAMHGRASFEGKRRILAAMTS